MLNETGNHEQDHLPALFFNLPGTIPMRKYSYRANMSMAPDDYAAGLQAVNKPMVILAGSKDEVFSAVSLQKAIMENSNGEVYIVEGATHNGIRHHMKSFKYIAQWFSKR
jgi:pimeloyl-ACP methyl ester carboxylesterase